MCKKGEIVQENIEMKMRILTRVTASDDDSFDEDNINSSDEEDNGDFMARCVSLSYNVEIGELHERDKFSWIDSKGVGRSKTASLEEKKLKQLDFKFKLNHIKQIVSTWSITPYLRLSFSYIDQSRDLRLVQAKEEAIATRRANSVRQKTILRLFQLCKVRSQGWQV